MSIVKKLAIYFAVVVAVLIFLLSAVFYVRLSTITEDTITKNMSELMSYCTSSVRNYRHAQTVPGISPYRSVYGKLVLFKSVKANSPVESFN